MRLLLVNPNTSESVTETLVLTARSAASEKTEIIAATASHGFSVIQTVEELEIARQTLLVIVRKKMTGVDGILVGISLDVAIDELQALSHLPVVGMTGGALSALGRRGLRIGAITFGESMTTLFMQRFPQIDSSLIETVNISPATAIAKRQDPGVLLKALEIAAENLVLRGAQVILPIGATVAGLASQVSARVPVLDPTFYSTQELERLVRLQKGN
jgi:allantoin racemase